MWIPFNNGTASLQAVGTLVHLRCRDIARYRSNVFVSAGFLSKTDIIIRCDISASHVKRNIVNASAFHPSCLAG
jgi:hypothetical protein